MIFIRINYKCFECKQVKLVKVFPLRYWGTMLSCVMAAIQSTVIGACVNRSKEAWRLEWNLQLITILYSVRSLNEFNYLVKFLKVYFKLRSSMYKKD